MKKYCFVVSEIKKKTTKIRVNAKSLVDAQNIIENAYESGSIIFDKFSEEDPELDYEIDLDSCNEDETFDDEQYLDEGIQLLE